MLGPAHGVSGGGFVFPILGSVIGQLHGWRPVRYIVALGAMAAVVAACSKSPRDASQKLSWDPRRVEVPRDVSGPARVGTVGYSKAPTPERALLQRSDRPVPKVRGVRKIGKPYEIAGVTYVPAEDPSYDRVGSGSWYGDMFHGKATANGELFDMNALTAAHPTLPMPSYLYVTNLRNGRTVLVRLNDRGPYKKGRIIDLSRAAARALDYETHGTTQVRVRYAGPAPLDPGDDARERRYLAAQAWGRRSSPPLGLGMGFAAGWR